MELVMDSMEKLNPPLNNVKEVLLCPETITQNQFNLHSFDFMNFTHKPFNFGSISPCCQLSSMIRQNLLTWHHVFHLKLHFIPQIIYKILIRPSNFILSRGVIVILEIV